MGSSIQRPGGRKAELLISWALSHWVTWEGIILLFQEHSWVWGNSFGVVMMVYLLNGFDASRRQTQR